MRVQVCGRGGRYCYTTLDYCLKPKGDKRMAGFSKGPTVRLKVAKPIAVKKPIKVRVTAKGKFKPPKVS